ncbi:type II toxin-antitoxin system HicB family antitoxin [Methylobacterium sp. JK268]
MVRYIGILEKEPGTLWGLWFPDLVGCTTAADTAEAALEQAPEALRLWLEGLVEDDRDPPAARSLDVLRDDPEVAEALSAGHAAVVVSVAEESLLDEAALTAIDSAAARRGLSRQRFIREALLEKATT